MDILDSISLSSSPTAPPALKFVGRPASPCKKCKSSRFYVNVAGCLECSACSPPPASLSNLPLRLVRISSGIWEQDDGTIPVPPLSSLHGQSDSRDSSTTSAATSSLHVSGDSWAGFDYSSVFIDGSLYGAMYDAKTGVPIFNDPVRRRLLPDEIPIAEWVIYLTTPNSPQRAAAASHLQGKLISAWERVSDANFYLTHIRQQCQNALESDQNTFGGIIDDMRRLKRWLDSNSDGSEWDHGPQPGRPVGSIRFQDVKANFAGLPKQKTKLEKIEARPVKVEMTEIKPVAAKPVLSRLAGLKL